jgi:hypothetical protein
MMSDTIRPVAGWVEEQVVRPRAGGGIAAADLAAKSADRMVGLMSGAAGRGAENPDPLRAGNLLPVPRLEAAIARIVALRARIDRALADKAETAGKARARGDLVAGLRRRLGEARDEALSVWRDLPPEMGEPALAVRLMAAVGGNPRMGGPTAPAESAARCPGCRRLLSPPKGVFGCMCGEVR